MGYFRRKARMDPNEISGLVGLMPLFDPVFNHLLEGAAQGRVDVYFAAVPFDLIRPFDPDYDPSKHPVGEAAIVAVSDEWRRGHFPQLWLYEKGDHIVMSDDYIPWAAALRGKPDYVPGWILGKPLNPRLADVQGPLRLEDVRAAIGLA